jgi:hypothetical protein
MKGFGVGWFQECRTGAMNKKTLRIGFVVGIAALVWQIGLSSASAQSVSGTIYNSSVWRESVAGPPGDADGSGELRVGIFPPTITLFGTPLRASMVTNGVFPLDYGPYPFTVSTNLADGDYLIVAWVDGDANGLYDIGEPSGRAAVTITASNSVAGVVLAVSDDSNENGLPDWWEYHWFRFTPEPFGKNGDEDTDGDGLLNKDEARISAMVPGLEYLNPNTWDTDADGMDDKWEWDHYSVEFSEGMNPCQYNATDDFDGDGLSDWQEYCGVDGYPLMTLGQRANGTDIGVASKHARDDLNPLDIDTDYDLLLDSFEAAWYDPGAGIDPYAGILVGLPSGTNVNTSIAQADPDHDGLSNYREQCLLLELRQDGVNGSKWSWDGRVPFPFRLIYREDGVPVRMCVMEDPGAHLELGLAMGTTIPAFVNRFELRNEEWTDPTEGTGYDYVDEPWASSNPGLDLSIPPDGVPDIPNPGHDTDGDWLPDGWEVEFGLDARDDGGNDPNNGPFGDPDDDGLWNYDEYVGQDGYRFTTREYVNGTGDETNPNRHDWRPDSTYTWRWYPLNATTGEAQTDPRVGTGISRAETMGSALPTTSIGSDSGSDSDDDGLTDWEEIHAIAGAASSPVSSCDPFLPKSVLITDAAGILIPDPERAEVGKYSPAGMRADLQRRDWTLECQVKLLSTNLSGDLFRFQTCSESVALTVYQLSLSNNVPVLRLHSLGSRPVSYVIKANALPTNCWVHLAAVWDHVNNGSGLYIDGVLYAAQAQWAESASKLMFPATNQLALAVSPDGSFVNHLMLDEVRIWGVARTQAQISEFSQKLVPSCNGDDVWLDFESPQYYSHVDSAIVNGGSLFEGEPGTLLSNVCQSANRANFWIDNGDQQYNAVRDVLLRRDATLLEGLAGLPISNVRWNDKDGDGKFSRDSLLANYRFDDGGQTVEDFARHAKTGLLGATREEYGFGDQGFALSTNHFTWVTNDAATVYGVDQRGADDADGDGMPDAWELVNALDAWDNGAINESYAGARDGFGGPLGDPDGDGLVNLYEFWSGTNPRDEDSDGNWIYDMEEDRDGDGLENVIEQELQCRPDMVDTDDDGSADGEEAARGTSPADPTDPARSLAVSLGGAREDYLDVPLALKQRLNDWTLEAWVRPADVTGGAGVVVRRAVANLPAGGYALNYVVGLEPNDSGGLRWYAGFVRPSGVAYMVRGGVVTPGTWAHVAASYQSVSRTLSLYTNGTLAATTNFTLVSAPPIDGPGGESFLRIGEDIAGEIDEVRIWNRARTPAEILANINHVVAGEDYAGLVHYFRFDDGEANTNVFAFSDFHQPGGLQDFTYTRDWNEQWRHAARPNGDAGHLEDGAIVPPPSLRLMLAPEQARIDGAQWTLDGGAWQNSGDSLQGLTPGDHILLYKSILGWKEPVPETVTLSNGVATTLTRSYEQKASLSVNIEPFEVRALEARWRLDGGPWMSSGEIVSNLNAGAHTLFFLPLAGWTEPEPETVVLTPGQVLTTTRAYVKEYGSVMVMLAPAEGVTAGAQWRINGGTWLNSGEVVGNLALTDHTIEFRTVPRWIAPGNVTVSLSDEQTVVITGQYSHVSALGVTLLPPEAVAAGAQWRLSNGEWTNSGVEIELPPGTYTVQFKDITNWLNPGSLSAVVSSQQLTSVTGSYFIASILGGEAGSEPGQFREPGGLAVDFRHRLYVADTFNNRIQRYDPYDGSWTVWGTFGTNAGQFDKPGGLTVDAQGNVYVADSNNNRIQKRTATNGQWRTWGAYGGAVGQFIGPSDVGVDSRTNLYVADLYNDRVQKMTVAGTWSVFITNGTMSGRVTAPKGLLIETNGIYVADADTRPEGLSRIQKFGTNGQFQVLLGSDLPDEGSLKWPGGMTRWEGDLYVADSGNNRVAVTPGTNMAWTTLIGNGVLNGPQDVAWDPRGILYIADTMNNRILALPLKNGATNAPVHFSSLTSPDSNSVVISWFGRLNWFYAVQYVDSLADTSWQVLPGCTNILGHNAETNCADDTIGETLNRFYRIISY